MAIIYMATNTANGKIYIGKTLLTLAERVRKHLSVRLAPRQVFQKALLKYGSEAFKWTILEIVSEAEVNDAERKWILNLRSTETTIGYNRSFGGDGGRKSFPDSLETRKLKATGMIGNRNAVGLRPGRTRKPLSDSHRKSLSKSMRGKNTDRKSEETREKLSQSMKRFRSSSPMTAEHKAKIAESVKRSLVRRR